MFFSFVRFSFVFLIVCFCFLFQWDEDVEVNECLREFGDIEWLHHNIITQNNCDGIIVSF